MKVYIASQTKHAQKWIDLRNKGLEISSTWIDQAGIGESTNLSDLAFRCIRESAEANWLILYCEEGDFLKGALMEVGAALASDVPVLCVGKCQSISATFQKHPLWFDVASMDDAIKHIRAFTRRSL